MVAHKPLNTNHCCTVRRLALIYGTHRYLRVFISLFTRLRNPDHIICRLATELISQKIYMYISKPWARLGNCKSLSFSLIMGLDADIFAMVLDVHFLLRAKNPSKILHGA